MKLIIRFFDKLEDHIRERLAHYPLFYSLIGGTGVVLFWRGVWHTADSLQQRSYLGSLLFSGPGSALLGMTVLLMTGLFVSVFIGDSIIMSGLKHDKKLIEKSEDEIEEELQELKREKTVLHKIEEGLERMEERVGEK